MRARCLVVALAALVPACDLAFGLSRDDEPVTVELTRRYLFNDQDFSATTRDDAYTLEELPSVEVYTQDGERLETDLAYPLRTFMFRRPPGAAYRVVLHVADAAEPIELQSEAPEVSLRLDVYHRRDAAKAAAFTSVSGTITPAGSTRLYTTGFAGVYELGAGAAYSVHTDYMLDATQFDRAYFVRYGTVGMVSSIVLAGIRDIRMQPGANDAPVELFPVSGAYCAHVELDHAAELARVAAAYPDFDDGDASGWAIYAIPSLDSIPAQAYQVATPLLQSLPVDAQYTVPFLGWKPVLNQGAQRSRKANDVVTLYVGTTSFAALPPSTSCTPATFEAVPVGIAAHARLDGVALDHDGVAIGGRAVHELVFEADGPGEVFEASLDDVTTGQRRLRRFGGAAPRFAIDGALLEAGHTYAFQLGVRRGMPGAASGDFATVDFPYASSYGYSSLFTVDAE